MVPKSSKDGPCEGAQTSPAKMGADSVISTAATAFIVASGEPSGAAKPTRELKSVTSAQHRAARSAAVRPVREAVSPVRRTHS